MKAERLTEEGLKSLVAAEIRAALTHDADSLAKKRADALEYYQGNMPDIPPLPGRSSVTSRDLADTIGWMLPGIIRVFTASDQFVIFEPEEPKDEDFVEDATAYANYVFYRDNDGYRILYDGTHDSLLHGNAIGKIWFDEEERCEYTYHTRVTAEQVAIIQADEGVTVVAADENEEPDTVAAMGPDGQPVEMPVPTFDIKVKREDKRGRIKIVIIPPEDFLIDRDAVTTAEARFTAHREAKTRSELIAMGFSKEAVDELPSDGLNVFSEEELARDEEKIDFPGTTSRSEELVELYECYLRADVDGDGESEMVRVYYAGNAGGGEVLDWEVFESEHPFFDIPCAPIPHRWEGTSIADKTMDIQRIKTALMRGLLDNVYAVNLPQPVVPAGGVKNMDSLLNPQFGQPILIDPAKSPNGIAWNVIPYVGDKVLQVLDAADKVLEKRTGVSRAMMALDPEALQNQTATANQNAKDAAYSQVELVARNQAELGWKAMFRKMLRLIVQHCDRPRMVKLRDGWKEIDPRPWNVGMDATVNVGLGTGSRDRDMAMLNAVLQNQVGLVDRLGPFMPEKAAEMLPKIINTMVKAAESAGLRNADEYYIDVAEQELQQAVQALQQAQQQPDPKVVAEQAKAQAQAQLEQAKLQMQAKYEEMKMQAQRDKEAAQMEADVVVKEYELAKDGVLKRQEFEFRERENAAKLALEREKMAQDRELTLLQMGMKDKGEQGGVVNQEDDRNQTVMAMLERLGSVVENMNRPRKIRRGPDGSIEGLD